MKILASDYDDTLQKNGHVSPETVMEIKKWQKEGNLFGLVTGRDYRFVEKEITDYGISYDFLVCSTGTAVYDKYKRKISATSFTDIEAQVITSFLAKLDRSYILFSGIDEIYFWGSEKALKCIQAEGISVFDINETNYDTVHALCQISIRFNTMQEVRGCAAVLHKLFGNVMIAHENAYCVDITPLGASKSGGVQAFLHASGNPLAEKVVINGSSYSDLPKVQVFAGYAVDDGR